MRPDRSAASSGRCRQTWASIGRNWAGQPVADAGSGPASNQRPASRECRSSELLRTEPGPLRDLARLQMDRGPGEQRQLADGHRASPKARASARIPSANERGA